MRGIIGAGDFIPNFKEYHPYGIFLVWGKGDGSLIVAAINGRVGES
jgi:hypothetical protein